MTGTGSHRQRTGAAYTPPKGRPTPKRGHAEVATVRHWSRRPALEWGAVVIAVVMVLGLLFAVFGGSGDGTSPHTQVPVGGHGG